MWIGRQYIFTSELDFLRNAPMCILVGDASTLKHNVLHHSHQSLHTVTKINPMDYADFKTRSQVWKSRKKILALTCRDYTSAKTMYLCSSIYSYISKVEKILKGSLNSIPSPSCSVKIQIMGGKVY